VLNPISLRLLSGQEYDVSKCLKELATDLDKRYKSLISGDFKKITHEYISHLYKRNEWFQFKNKSGIFTGKILTVTQDGRLVVEKQDHTTDEYSFKEIEFIL
jgi:BirA family biotin operon repressor/biotin-[acetyl-CoA-carboxylase] ligase